MTETEQHLLRPRPFVLHREIDLTGISGCGPIAEGVEWSDGTVSLRWNSKHRTVTFWQDGIASVEAVHGHGGTTRVNYLGGPQASCHPPQTLSQPPPP